MTIQCHAIKIICSHGVRVLAALQSSHHHHHVLLERSNLAVSEAAVVGKPALGYVA